MTFRNTLIAAVIAAFGFGCGETTEGGSGGEADSENGTYGGSNIKADSVYSECHLIEVLKAVNESTSDVDRLKSMGINKRAAKNIYAYRVGPDGVPGTGDDNLFDDHDELDGVPYVGPKTMGALVKFVDERCEDDMLRPFMDSETFGGRTGGGWKRDNVELEATYTVTGVTPQKLHAVLFEEDADGKTGFQTLRKHRIVEAFTYDYGIDEMPWNSKAHNLRESFPYVALSIESGRFELDEEDGRRELSLGTDYMDDVYFDTKDFALLKNEIQVRGRIRWDTTDSVRRLLIAAKFGAGVDANGIKRAAKIDVRTEGGDHKDTLIEDVQRGTVTWQGSETPIEPLSVVYERMNELKLLPDLDGFKDVLMLLPQVYLRSARSRYHMNEASFGSVKDMFDNGKTRISGVIEAAEAAIAAGTLGPAEELATEELITRGRGILDDSLINAQILAALKTKFPMATEADAIKASPGNNARPRTVDELKQRELAANAIKELYDDFSYNLGNVEREIADNVDGKWDDLAEQWRDYVIAKKQSSLVTTTTWTRFHTIWKSIPEADQAAELAAFNAFGAEQDDAKNKTFKNFEPVTDWAGIGKDLTREQLKIAGRQIEAAGTAARTLWFDTARSFYVPSSRRYTSNFLIDTMDVAQMLTKQEWETLTDEQRKPGAILPPEKVFKTVLVNEVQIELGAEKEYLARIADLQAEIDNGTAAADAQLRLAGARFIFDEYRSTLQIMAELKGDRIRDKLKDAGVRDIVWGPATASKGQTAMRVISDND